ncbi:hypothetical protein NSK_005505 [Nannochloropsis salina CCMP1776]|uniref:Uncharacterized protein n=1 Tax=Nannochloropsis salina CCMP1776 TaxID=1027361 RepID=A0A4D9CW81_9STRA|nr:hypothetical protein NSK_005505 [Nannochloropsis salina CCMP1776]|eukprot:TFJ83196.1 hypothetical protein NSK_005505 [Nannochloropsis salina CCMP1776]
MPEGGRDVGRGYDVYTPHRSVVYHDYNHGPSTVAAASWTRDGRELQRSRNRLKVLLGDSTAPLARNTSEAHAFLARWDLGNRRSLEQLIQFTGVDTVNREILHSSCGYLAWVPFEREGEGEDDDRDPREPDAARHQAEAGPRQRSGGALQDGRRAKIPWTFAGVLLSLLFLVGVLLTRQRRASLPLSSSSSSSSSSFPCRRALASLAPPSHPIDHHRRGVLASPLAYSPLRPSASAHAPSPSRSFATPDV